MINNFLSIRNQTRLALSGDDLYLYRLGVALYWFNSVNSFLTEIICHIDRDKDRISLLDKTSGNILIIFKDVFNDIKEKWLFSKIYENMQNVIDLFSKLNDERTDFVHSYPITNKDFKQILHRRKDKNNKYFEITNEFLDSFTSSLNKLSDNLYIIREEVNPNL